LNERYKRSMMADLKLQCAPRQVFGRRFTDEQLDWFRMCAALFRRRLLPVVLLCESEALRFLAACRAFLSVSSALAVSHKA
jgi:hypothetical protein